MINLVAERASMAVCGRGSSRGLPRKASISQRSAAWRGDRGGRGGGAAMRPGPLQAQVHQTASLPGQHRRSGSRSRAEKRGSRGAKGQWPLRLRALWPPQSGGVRRSDSGAETQRHTRMDWGLAQTIGNEKLLLGGAAPLRHLTGRFTAVKLCSAPAASTRLLKQFFTQVAFRSDRWRLSTHHPRRLPLPREPQASSCSLPGRAWQLKQVPRKPQIRPCPAARTVRSSSRSKLKSEAKEERPLDFTL